MTAATHQFGIVANRAQFAHQLGQVLLVGFAIGMTRTVVPALAESEFGLERGSFLLLSAFVVAFGVVKGVLNFVAGRLSERIGRKKVLVLGWLVALPIPVMIAFAPDWNWIVAATVLLGVNQGLCWSMAQTSKLDLTRPNQRGVVIGLNEFSGYVGVALAGIITAYAATLVGPREGLLAFGLVVVGLGLILSVFFVRDTLPWAHSEARSAAATAPLSTWEVFTLMSWRDRRLAAISQAGLVEKFVDALVWVIYPVFLFSRGLSLPEIGWVVGIYGVVWGGSQLLTGPLSDKVGRHWPNVSGMWICGVGVAMMVLGEGFIWWSLSAAVSGLGMALLYPNLSAAVADIAAPTWRGSAIGIYRFWRDLGYAIGALGFALAANLSGQIETTFWFVAAAMLISGTVLLIWGEETRPT
ncbi:MFS transporter [Pelagibacterium lentulum]|uniref:MFS transporter n=1 Tax=Pelagibacterium lentulum TaxID=2029865 RepID=A0A916VWY4_9HYPH|nr:MFS transporter [Pelagibacterium lentulum]GGA48926.1 MFS transporter [Pelagibacterium lentulum]